MLDKIVYIVIIFYDESVVDWRRGIEWRNRNEERDYRGGVYPKREREREREREKELGRRLTNELDDPFIMSRLVEH